MGVRAYGDAWHKEAVVEEWAFRSIQGRRGLGRRCRSGGAARRSSRARAIDRPGGACCPEAMRNSFCGAATGPHVVAAGNDYSCRTKWTANRRPMRS